MRHVNQQRNFSSFDSCTSENSLSNDCSPSNGIHSIKHQPENPNKVFRQSNFFQSMPHTGCMISSTTTSSSFLIMTNNDNDFFFHFNYI